MTTVEMHEYLREHGWVTHSRGLWWGKNGKNYRATEAVDIEKESNEVHGEYEPVTISREDFDHARAVLQEQKKAKEMPESVKETLEQKWSLEDDHRAVEALNSPYHHISAGYAKEMIDAIQRVGEETKEGLQSQVKTYNDLTSKEERLHAF